MITLSISLYISQKLDGLINSIFTYCDILEGFVYET